jgi:hypothetical protein
MLENQGATLWWSGFGLLIRLQTRMPYISPIQIVQQKPSASSPIYSSPAVPLGVNSSSCKRIHHGPSVGLPRPFSSAPNLLLALLLISLYRAEADVPETISDAAVSDNDLVHSAIVYRQTIAKARR